MARRISYSGKGYFEALHHSVLSPVVPFTRHVAALLRRVYLEPPYEIRREWQALTKEEVRGGSAACRRMLYSPAIDLAVGPFATHQTYVNQYDQMAKRSAKMLREMLRGFGRTLQEFGSDFPAPTLNRLCTFNLNSRCFLAIEIERGNSSTKYLIGSALHASCLGRIGVVLAWHRRRLEQLLRQREYLISMENLGKNGLKTDNLIFLDKEEFARIVARAAGRVRCDDNR